MYTLHVYTHTFVVNLYLHSLQVTQAATSSRDDNSESYEDDFEEDADEVCVDFSSLS